MAVSELVMAPTLSDLSPGELGERLTRRRYELDLQEIQFCIDAAAFAATDEYERQGFTSPIEWVRQHCKMTSGAVADRICVGEQMPSIPESVNAMLWGEIGFAHLALIAQTAQALNSSPTARRFDERNLLGRARNEDSITRFRRFCHHFRHAADPEGYVAKEQEEVAARSLEISDGHQGGVFLKGYLDSAGGAALRGALEPLARKSGADDERKRDRRLADALLELATGRARPTQLQVTASFETLKAATGAPGGEIEFALPISAEAVRRMACDCSLTRILLDSDSQVIDVGRAKRTISPPQKRALRARDGGCRWPGCDRTATWSEGHHIKHWLDGGGSDLANLLLLCYRHHMLVHEGKWQLVGTGDGRILTVPPPTFVTTRPRGPD